MTSNLAKIEALLFVSGDQGITPSELANLTGLAKPAVFAQLDELKKKYQVDSTSSLKLHMTDERVRLTTKSVYAPLLENYFAIPNQVSLSRAAMETLSIIAYKQPVTRADIEEIRGVGANGALKRLLLLDLITEAGRLEVPGRPIVYATTEFFLDRFGLHSLQELPPFPQAEQLDLPLETDDLLARFNDLVEPAEDKEEK
ncbi:MAG: SMC-Scp complex subunit ScpB [Liquorilactobacillus nagelii]|jgi:segregation and condensation protein B|uniref:Segregation and condensation protein B n=1 Tax=Liquorilactobacillus nagelii TaxID=82688 RepID=A0A3Q8CUT4_9LACO|nr:SMC-Scp complex subunit ScpB [Liquorilactobacillus nagelii]AUJ32197.1 SMC-Scp complex subunit ScpB [Liquorilactobacillus nagelii]KRL40894.1 segregation and condensation protein ScpB [Liquorilactobacillus nagelii DSM 13675]MCC7615368.1 SMC-Scp complex subunit ScpB [Liquorilactobacillus nagelii]MCI1920596.1 SMC-Scp complex subunit ScpB [Liquorilactobacillus nagelii]MCI1976941.1 SMC-Scp complex subunit ScpB [Liquorilactobacillus nagelii]